MAWMPLIRHQAGVVHPRSAAAPKAFGKSGDALWRPPAHGLSIHPPSCSAV